MSRNLKEYPIKKEEILDALDKAEHLARKNEGIGGLDGYILSVVRDYIQEHLDEVVKLYG